MARFFNMAASSRPPRDTAISRRMRLSAGRRAFWILLSNATIRFSGSASNTDVTPSSKYGKRASFPWSLTIRSSRPRLRFHRRFLSKRSSERKAFVPPSRHREKCRPYPPICSSAPIPSNRTRARERNFAVSRVSSLPQLLTQRPNPRASVPYRRSDVEVHLRPTGTHETPNVSRILRTCSKSRSRERDAIYASRASKRFICDERCASIWRGV